MSRTAAEKYEAYKEKDPFPNIDAALLNSADIQDYVNTTGMVDPFYDDKLKSGSYEVKIKGECKYWDENGVEHSISLEKEHDTFKLTPNSIAFIEVEPIFRLPNYIALRFNLKIKNVYRGLLLGTGPLIDPGFEGKIFIPLHNLTSNTYTFECGEGLIWVEFTKISKIRGAAVCSASPSRVGVYHPFPGDKKNKPLKYYLNNAKIGGKIASSIPPAVEKAKISAEQAKSELESINTKLKWGGVIAVLAVLIAVGGLTFPGWQLQSKYVDNLNDLRKDSIQQAKQYSEISSDLSRLHDENESQKRKLKQLKTKIENLSSAIAKKSMGALQVDGAQGVQNKEAE